MGFVKRFARAVERRPFAITFAGRHARGSRPVVPPSGWDQDYDYESTGAVVTSRGMSSAAPSPSTKARERVGWLDLFRGTAVVAMIETHVVNTFLAPELREAAWFGWLNWFNGLIAPAFLFIAGYALGMSWRADAARPAAFGRKAKRLLAVAALGYALHFPFTELSQRRWPDALRTGTQVDVLQCLAAALFAVLGVQMASRVWPAKWRSAGRLAVLTGLAAGTVLLAPFSPAWEIGPLPLAAFLNDHTGSLFPLFPWAAFVFSGALAGAFASRPPAWLLAAAGGVKACAHLAGDGTFSALSPAFFCERLAWVLALAAVCQWVARAWQPRGILFAGRESLVMYAAHLVVIEGLSQAGVPRGGSSFGGAALLLLAVLPAAFAVAFAKTKWSARPVAHPA